MLLDSGIYQGDLKRGVPHGEVGVDSIIGSLISNLEFASGDDDLLCERSRGAGELHRLRNKFRRWKTFPQKVRKWNLF